MSNHTDILFERPTYTRSDYAALRAHCLNLSIAKITSLYYIEDAPQLKNGLERFLLDMRADLIERAIVHNPALATILKNARAGGAITTKALEILVKAAEAPQPIPHPDQKLSQWLKPITANALAEEKLITIQNLMDWIAVRGTSWWRSIPRIGELKAKVLVKWLQSHSQTLGRLQLINTNITAPYPAPIAVHPNQPGIIAPIDRITTTSQYDGSAGVNRSPAYCYISANNDLEAIKCYLLRFADQKHALRAYKKELERFLLWAIVIKAMPMSSLNATDCEEYKAFLAHPAPSFCGPKAPRHSKLWKPFNDNGSLSPLSQRHAIGILRAAFDYWVKVRYLAGNPWAAVKDPIVVKEVDGMHIEKALPAPLWDKLVTELKVAGENDHRYRTALAIVLLMGDSGLRREEVATARRESITKSQFADCMELEVVGKGHKKRIVPISARAMKALEVHWLDRGLDVQERDDLHLLSPLTIPAHEAAQKKLESNRDGYTPGSLYRIIQTAIKKLLKQVPCPFDAEEFHQLESTTAHAFRHTFGTLSVAKDVPIDVVQAVLGHASVGTTSIYVQSKKKRIMEEAAKYFFGATT
ncbi:phage integrase family protein [Sapientia aquatica]|uniref:Integrase n=1 Tax=Sapientia aquatica TaxID=1549640 RepID=A0A4R5VM85_9BURK|nr:phage integrase family protein [Sapientia aquatica]TDK59212.1 integrase [Sapientia aquatica]